jgi:hypothetical protein
MNSKEATMNNRDELSRTEQKAREDRRRAEACKSACDQQERDLAALDAETRQDAAE